MDDTTIPNIEDFLRERNERPEYETECLDVRVTVSLTYDIHLHIPPGTQDLVLDIIRATPETFCAVDDGTMGVALLFPGNGETPDLDSTPEMILFARVNREMDYEVSLME